MRTNTLDQYKIRIGDQESSFTSLKRALATLIRSNTGFDQGYNVNKVYERYQQISELTVLEEQEVEKLIKSVRANHKKIIPITEIAFVKHNVKEYIHRLLGEKPIHRSVERFSNDVDLREWAHIGYDIHSKKKSKVCGFCQNKITQEQWIELEEYFNDSLKEFKEKIREAKNALAKYRTSIQNYKGSIPVADQLYKEFEHPFQIAKKDAEELCDIYDKFLQGTIGILERKEDFEGEELLMNEFNETVLDLEFDYSKLENLNEIIKEHNSKSKDFNKSISKDKLKLENHFIANVAPNIREYEATIKRLNEEKRKEEQVLTETEDRIAELQNKVKNSRIPAKAINKDISFILGRSNLVFEWKETGYEIRRDGKIAERLSKGEKNALALIYFFNALMDSEVQVGESIIVLDDPISSFDSNYYYSAIAYIREKIEVVGQAFIFTHKFSLYKDLSRMLNNAGQKKYLLERKENSPILRKEDDFLRDFEDEYSYLFKTIYDFVKEPPSIDDYVPYPNMGRRLLEGFLSFKLPEKGNGKKDILSKAISMEKEGGTERVRAITRLVQNQSVWKRREEQKE